MKLLIADDSLIVRRIIERGVAWADIGEIRFALTGRAAIEEYRTFQPDIVTMDITMPEMDGLSALDAILRDDPHARILIVSALADKHTAVEAVKRGAQGFLLKPITATSLREAITDLLEE